jgi:signal transduction histidine kinase
MMNTDVDDRRIGVQLLLAGEDRMMAISGANVDRVRQVARRLVGEPFTKRTWSELLFFIVGGALAFVGFAVIATSMFAGIALAITFIGVVIVASSVRTARRIGCLHRGLARNLLHEHIEDPEPFLARPGVFGWLQSSLRDRTGWRAIAYSVAKIPLSIFGIWFAFSVWVDALFCLGYPLWGAGSARPPEFGIVRDGLAPGYFSVGTTGFFHGFFIFITGVLLAFVAPWTMRAVVFVDRRLMRLLLGPDAVTKRVRSLEHARAQTLDASAATLRQIERDLHDGTQAQLVALAMRLGLAKEKLAARPERDLDQVRQLVDDAHKGAKEAIIELRDLARGIHPPALDTGLEGALSTLAARSTVPSDLKVILNDRPSPAIEAIAARVD